MCITMVIISSKKLDKKKGADDVITTPSHMELCEPATISRGTTLFSHGIMEADHRWQCMGQSFSIQKQPANTGLDGLWGMLPTACQRSPGWGGRAVSSSTTAPITALIRQLSLSEPPSSTTTAPPTKRQCRSLSFSDGLSAHQSAFRPLPGSRAWASAEKRRCHSGGCVQRSSGTGWPSAGSPAMQRSSSFSLPSRSNILPFGFTFTGFQPSSPYQETFRPFSLSTELISPSEPQCPSTDSSPDSTPELGRRQCPGGLARSRSQPCVLNDKKVGMKRRRPEEGKEQRPSLSLDKMTLKRRSFHSCPGIAAANGCQSSNQLAFAGTEFTSLCAMGAKPHERTPDQTEDSSTEELDSDSSTNEEEDEKKDVSQLGGELDLEQIERN